MLQTSTRSLGSTCRRLWELPIISSIRSSSSSSACDVGGKWRYDLSSGSFYSRGFKFDNTSFTFCGLKSLIGRSSGIATSSLHKCNTKSMASVVAGDSRRFSASSGIGGHCQYPFAASGVLSAAGILGPWSQQVRTIMVEVKKNDLEKAIRRWRRKCKEENLRALKDRDYYIKPSEKRVLARKERDHRVAKRSFKQKLNWIMTRRERGF
ncbi:hypothetical protein R1flu_018607 [Riccia fluitans]|uniref:Ribosomal protein S21 n=1 Tax=Riccia fluitans TaxID=41844 RepID=A0ABD1ZK98_9MARC